MRKRSGVTLSALIHRYKKWLWAALVLFFGYSFFSGSTGFYSQLKLFFQGRRLEKQLQQARFENKQLTAAVDSLKTDSDSIKGAAYELGLAADDEIIIIVDEDKK